MRRIFEHTIVDVARGDNHIAGVFGVGHNLIMVIYIIVFIIDALDSYDRHALSEVDINETVLSLVAFGRFDERTLYQSFLYMASTNLVQRFL